MKLTREQAIKEHRKMWNWIADTSEKEGRIVIKNEYMEKAGYGFLEIASNCFCCEYNGAFDNAYCHHCPVIWYEGQNDYNAPCMHSESPFSIYFGAIGLLGLASNYRGEVSVEEYVKMAREIANLKEAIID